MMPSHRVLPGTIAARLATPTKSDYGAVTKQLDAVLSLVDCGTPHRFACVRSAGSIQKVVETFLHEVAFTGAAAHYSMFVCSTAM